MKCGTIVPLYTYPDHHSWRDIRAAAAKFTVPVIAIINPADGVGQERDDAYVNGIRLLHQSNVKVLGYVATNYADRSIDKTKAECKKWRDTYNIQGIFLDEESDTKDAYYREVTGYVKNDLSLKLTVGNPGTDVKARFFAACDVTFIYETENKPTITSLKKYQPYRDRVGIIPYEVEKINSDWIKAASAYIKWMYLTDDTLNNPWDSLASYFEKFLEVLAHV